MYVASLALGRAPDDGTDQAVIATSFAYALEDIPTCWLEEAFKLAIRNKRDDFMLAATAVNRAYDDMLPEIQRMAEIRANGGRRLLGSGEPEQEEMGPRVWKARHNLPEDWRPGDPYPPESDLHGRGNW